MAGPLASDVEKAPVGNPVNKPASGSYGDKAEVDRLKEALPDPSPGSPGDPSAGAQTGSGLPPVDPSGVRNSRSNRSAAGLPGLPAPILAPSNRPNSPAGLTGRDPGPGPVQATAGQQRLAVLDMLASSPDVAEETREWAKLVIRILTG